MTDKQIIIDGVDVSGCEWFYKNDPCKNTCKYFCTPCEWVEIQKCMYKYAKCKEQECEGLREAQKNSRCAWKSLEGTFCPEAQEQLDQLKAEVKSKTEYIQEQRDIINQYSKEIEMYKKCQGKRASKREEELKVENDNIKETFDGLFKVQYKLSDNNKKLRQCLTEIKEIATENSLAQVGYNPDWDIILQKISEVEDEHNG